MSNNLYLVEFSNGTTGTFMVKGLMKKKIELNYENNKREYSTLFYGQLGEKKIVKSNGVFAHQTSAKMRARMTSSPKIKRVFQITSNRVLNEHSKFVFKKDIPKNKVVDLQTLLANLGRVFKEIQEVRF